ncbi:MAG: hypothetical protein IKX18_02240 [Muribaculaceae bacterium]|nr:hypothetical protein [Muribaculaceae bacterium]
MKKLFSLLTLALLTMSAWAQSTVTLDFTTNGWGLPTDYTTGPTTYTNNDGYAITLQATNGYKFAGSYLIMGKKGTTLSLPAFQYPVSKIEVVGNSGASTGVIQNIYVDTVAVSAPTTGATGTNVYEIAEDYQAAGNIYTLKVTSAHNTQITKIIITVEDGSTPPVTVAAPEFHPNGGKFTVNSLPVTITCADSPCDIYYSEGTELDWTNYTHYSGEFYVTETKTFTAVAYKGGVESAPTTVTFTKVDPAPDYTFLPIVYDAVSNAAFSVEKDGVTFDCSKGAITNDQFRIYKNQTATFTAGDGVADIVKIEFFCTAEGANEYGPGCFTLDSKDGSYSYEDTIGTWTGKARNVSLTASTYQVRATKIVFTLDDGTTPYVLAPTLPESQNFDDTFTVTITNNEEGATVKYSLNDGDYTEYEAPFTINETTTVKAYAEYDGIQSNTVSATYTKNEPAPGITTLAEANAVAVGDSIYFEGTGVVVTYQNGKYTFLRDATGYGNFYQDDASTMPAFTNGQVLNPGWKAIKAEYKNFPEYKNATNVSASESTNAELAAPVEITALNDNLLSAYVTVKNIKKFAVSGKNVTITMSDGTTTMVGYNQFNIDLTEMPTTEGEYTAIGVVGKYNSNLQLWIISWEGQGAPEPDPTAVNSIGEAYQQESGTKITMYNDVVVTYQNGNRLWIRDTENASGMIYGALDATFANGDVLSDGWTATYELFNGLTPEFTNPKDISDSGDDREAAPFERTTITTANVNEYVILKGVTLTPDTADTDIYYTADNLQICNFFNGVEIPTVEEGKTYDVTGIVLISQAGLVRVYITEMTEVASAGLRGDVDDSGTVDITDATTLINYLLNGDATGMNLDNANCDLQGGVDISDATTLINFLLNGTWPN